MKKYAKTKELAIAEIEAQVAMAKTIPEAMKRGDMSAVRNSYQLANLTINGAEVNRWRRVSKIPANKRRKFYADNSLPTRAALLRRWEQMTLDPLDQR